MVQVRSLKYSIFFRSLISFVELLFSVFTFPYVARILMPTALGQVDFANTSVTYFILVSTFGIAEYGAREIGLYKSDLDKLSNEFSNLITFRIFLAILFFALFFAFVIPFYGHGSVFFIIASISIVLSVFNVTWALEAFEAFDALAIARFITRLLLLVGIFLFVRTPDDAIIYLGLQILSDSLYFVYSYFKLSRIFKFDIYWKNIANSFKNINLNALVKIFSLNVVQASIASIPIFVLGYLKRFEEIGFFSSANRFFWLAYYLIIPISNVLTMRSYGLQGNSDGDRDLHRHNSLNGLLFIGLPIMGGLFVTSNEVIHLFVGSAYYQSILSLQILSLLVPIYILNNFWGMQVLFVERMEKRLVQIYLIGVILNFSVSVFCAMKGILIGPSVSMVLSNFVVCILLGFAAKKFYSAKSIKNDLLKLFVSTSFMVLAVLLIDFMHFKFNELYLLILKVIVGVFVYACAIILFKHRIAIAVLQALKLQ